MYDLIREFRDQEGLHNLEGERGVQNLEKIIEAIGYKAHGFRHGSLVEVFLADNSAAIEMLIDFIAESDARTSGEWRENLESNIEDEVEAYSYFKEGE